MNNIIHGQAFAANPVFMVMGLDYVDSFYSYLWGGRIKFAFATFKFLFSDGGCSAKLLEVSCGFIRVEIPLNAGYVENEYSTDPRDRTRIHFESYKLTRTVARDALDDDGYAACGWCQKRETLVTG